MNRIKEMVQQITKKGWIIIGIVALVIILGGVTTLYGAKNSSVWPVSLFKTNGQVKEVDTQTNQFVAQATEQVFTKEDAARGEYKNDTQSATMYVNSTEEVTVAVVVDNASRKVIDDAKKISCGHVTFVTTRVAGPAILTNTLRALFADKVSADFTPGNIIPSYHPELTLEKVMIDNGVAKIYLGGNFNGKHDGWCDASLAVAQIVETSKTFSGIKTVEVYQGGEKIY
jgi:hypothetical protein